MIRKAKFELFLPLKFNARKEKNRKPIPKKLFKDVEKSLYRKFDGFTMAGFPVIGSWLYESRNRKKRKMNDTSMRYEVWTKDVNGGRAYMKKLQQRLINSFKQKEIAIIESTI